MLRKRGVTPKQRHPVKPPTNLLNQPITAPQLFLGREKPGFRDPPKKLGADPRRGELSRIQRPLEAPELLLQKKITTPLTRSRNHDPPLLLTDHSKLQSSPPPLTTPPQQSQWYPPPPPFPLRPSRGRLTRDSQATTLRSIKSLVPLLDRVLVQRVKAEAKTASGLFLPESSVKELNEARVLAVGPGGLDKDGKRLPMGVSQGDRVLIPQYGGSPVKVGEEEFTLFRDGE